MGSPLLFVLHSGIINKIYSLQKANRRGATLGFSLKADFVCNSIYDIPCSALAERGISLLLADLDNTLAPYGAALPDERVKNWCRELKNVGINLFVLSNNRRDERPRVFCQAMNIPFIGHAGKPKTAGFYLAMEQMNVNSSQTAIVGDQVFTDVLGGNRAEVMTILVKPISLAGNPGRYLRYAAEFPFRYASLTKGKGFEK